MEKVGLFPSADFIAKNQLTREGSQNVSPVTVPALTTIVDRQFNEDRTLCPLQVTGLNVFSLSPLRKDRPQTSYTFFLTQTKYPTLLQTSRPTSLGPGPSQSA